MQERRNCIVGSDSRQIECSQHHPPPDSFNETWLLDEKKYVFVVV